MRLAHAVQAALLLACGAVSVSAWADSPAATLSWRAPTECPQAEAFTAQVERFLGQPLASARAQDLRISGEVLASDARGYVAHLRVQGSGAARERELSHRDCAELTEAAALVTALAIDPTLTVPENGANTNAGALADESAAKNPAGNAPPPTAPAESALKAATPGPGARLSAPSLKDSLPTPPSARSVRAAIAAVGLLGNAVLPGVGVGVGARARVQRASLALGLQADYWLPRSRSVGDGGAGIELGAWGAGVTACGVPLSGRMALALCGGGVVGDMYGAGNGFLSSPRTSHRRWSGLEAELDLTIMTTSSLATWLGLNVGKTLEAPHFGVKEDGRPVELFTPSGWTMGGFVGLGVFR